MQCMHCHAAAPSLLPGMRRCSRCRKQALPPREISQRPRQQRSRNVAAAASQPAEHPDDAMDPAAALNAWPDARAGSSAPGAQASIARDLGWEEELSGGPSAITADLAASDRASYRDSRAQVCELPSRAQPAMNMLRFYLCVLSG